MMIVASCLAGGALLLVLILCAAAPWICQTRRITRSGSESVRTVSRRVSQRDAV